MFASKEGFSSKLDHALYLTELRIKRNQDVARRDWFNFPENYRAGYMGLHLPVTVIADGKDHCFSVLIVKEGLFPRPATHHFSDEDWAASTIRDGQPALSLGTQRDKPVPVLIGVSDLVHTPEGVVSSGVWLLRDDTLPLVGGELIFKCLSVG